MLKLIYVYSIISMVYFTPHFELLFEFVINNVIFAFILSIMINIFFNDLENLKLRYI